MSGGETICSGYADKRDVLTVYANFLRGRPSSTLCLNGPRSTSRISSGFCFESSLIRSKMKSVSPLKISPQVCERHTTFTEWNAAFFTWSSSSLKHSSKGFFRGRSEVTEQCFAAAKRIAETAEARTRHPS